MKYNRSIQAVRETVTQSKDAPDYDIDNPPPGDPLVIDVSTQQADEDLVRALIDETNYDDDPDPIVMTTLDFGDDDF
jgi:hypothetical protein